MSKTTLLALAAAIALAGQHAMIWLYAPVAQSGLVQKVFYIHLPLAWWALVSFLVVFVASLGYLFRRSPGLDALAATAAELGVLFSGLVLVTGSLWARAEWGHWWLWDPKLTTALIMWYVYAGYLVLRAAPIGRERKGLVCAAVGVVAFLDVPLVFFATTLWGGVHPADTARKSSGMTGEMWLTVASGMVAVGLLWLTLLILRRGQRRAEARVSAAFARRLESENANDINNGV